ncbi:MAG: hypothetical protein CMB80_13280 [Flammeovirgaceae bacterium]|nr:hypothetical protein [Flammeovirgaceae bacterium]MBE62003.1 hypothetical protein [Flammeovirgaceae bacterium]MBR06252.1 hypothetical protein [Rickettsiales bacterium]HCX23478.1 hypothetical protein [Cytophagales bacterium]|tara:strand:- start:4107 stop:4406 length:300 start_codon:yes stop_codon:yes gene_type:complete
MDEITLVNLLNKICEANDDLTWKLNCQYDDGQNNSIMQVKFIRLSSKAEISCISFQMETGLIYQGRHSGMVNFQKAMLLTDVLLDILIYESSKLPISQN